MKLKRLGINSVVSVSVVASMLLQTGIGAFAVDDIEEDFGETLVTISESEPSEYGDIDVQFIAEDGTPVELSLVPDSEDMDYLDGSLPSSYDLRDYGLVTSVKYQGSTGTCWAHSALAAAESALIKDGLADNDIDLSEAHLVWFSQGSATTDPDDPLYGDGSVSYNLGVGAYKSGGHIYHSRSTLGSWIGADHEANYANVVTFPELNEKYRYNSIFHLQNSYEFDPSDRNSIKAYLMDNGALTLSYNHNDIYENQTTDNTIAYYNNVDTKTNHAVTLVGWNDNYSKNNFATTAPGNGAWLIKNSWDTWYGDGGYFWISYYDTSIARIASMEMENISNYSDIYQYAGVYRNYLYNDYYGGGMGNIFTAESDAPLTAVSFQTIQASTPYEIRIYSGSTYGKPLSGTLVHTQSGELTYAGLHTIKLNKLVNIPSGTNFSVFIYMDKNSSGVVMDDYSTTTGRCFYGWGNSLDTITWKDAGNLYNCDIHIKAYTAGSTAPKNVQATAGDGKVTLTWDKVDGATKYAVALYSGGKYKTYTNTLTSTSYTVSGLTNGTKYTFLVQAYVNGKWSTFTSDDYVTATPVGAAKPVVTATAGNGTVTLKWNAVSGATKYAVALYSGGKYKTYTSTLTSTSYTVSGLTNGTAYTFLVQAYVNGAWNKFTSDDYVTATPVGAAKPEVTATAGDGKVTLTWNKVDGATKYAVALYSGGKYKTYTSTLTSTSYTVSGLTNGTKYEFLVQAYVNGKWTAASTADHVFATPVGAAKPVVTATAGDGKVTLTWNKVDGATKYAVALYSGGKYKTYTATLTSTSYTVSGLTNGTAYTFLVQAYVNGAWNKFTSDDYVIATPVGAAKPEVTATAGDGTVTLKWNAVSGATKYAVALYSGGKYKTYTSTLTSTSYTVSGLTNGTEYTFLVQAYVNGAWNKFTSDDYVTATPVGAAKPVVTATAGNGTVTLKWNAVSGATKYAVALYSGGKYKTYTSTLTSTSYTVSGLTNGTEYTFLVQAYVNGAWNKFTTADHVSATPKA